jgi:hypothetical protein
MEIIKRLIRNLGLPDFAKQPVRIDGGRDERMAVNDTAEPKAPPPPSKLAGLGVAAVLVVAIVGWVALGGAFLSETSLFGGFLVLWYWAKVEHLAPQRLSASIIGGLVGIGVAWVMFFGATNYGALGFAVGLTLLVVSIYLDIIQVFPLFVNASTMLFSIIAAAPLVQLKINWVELCLATAGGGIFFAACVAAANWLASRLSTGPA